MPFGLVSGVGRGIGVLERGEYHRRGRGSFVGKHAACDCNQRGLCDSLCNVVILSAVSGGDAALLKLLRDFFFTLYIGL